MFITRVHHKSRIFVIDAKEVRGKINRRLYCVPQLVRLRRGQKRILFSEKSLVRVTFCNRFIEFPSFLFPFVYLHTRLYIIVDSCLHLNCSFLQDRKMNIYLLDLFCFQVERPTSSRLNVGSLDQCAINESCVRYYLDMLCCLFMFASSVLISFKYLLLLL